MFDMLSPMMDTVSHPLQDTPAALSSSVSKTPSPQVCEGDVEEVFQLSCCTMSSAPIKPYCIALLFYSIHCYFLIIIIIIISTFDILSLPFYSILQLTHHNVLVLGQRKVYDISKVIYRCKNVFLAVCFHQ